MKEDTPKPEEEQVPDDELISDIRKVLSEKTGKDPEQLKKEIAEEEEKADIPRVNFDPEIDYGAYEESRILRERRALMEKVRDFTTDEKELFLEAVLCDTPFHTTIEKMGGKFNVKFRTRSVEEQEAIVRFIRMSIFVGDIPVDNNPIHLAYSEYATILITCQEINGQPFFKDIDITKSNFSGPYFPENTTVQEIKADPLYSLFKEGIKHIRKTNQMRLNVIVNAAIEFEGLCAKLLEEVTKENFSDPQD